MDVCDVKLLQAPGFVFLPGVLGEKGRRHWGSVGAKEVLTGFEEILLHEAEQVAQELCSSHPWGFLRSGWTNPSVTSSDLVADSALAGSLPSKIILPFCSFQGG